MRVYNFSAGPATLPEDVLEQAKNEMLDWQGHGMSVMEMSHRSKEFIDIAAEAEADLRELMDVPLNYKILFLQGGATGQFSAIPLNISRPDDRADYAVTGMWSKKAFGEAEKYLKANIAIKTDAHTHVPEFEDWDLSEDSAYLHITPNEAIHGVAFHELPKTNVPIVADMSSMILSQPVNVADYGVIYAGAQKNIGPAGITIVIVKDALLGKSRSDVPMVWDWQGKSESGSMLNTPPTYSWYLAGLVFKWLKKNGGIDTIHKKNLKKAEKLYSAIDESDFYTNPVEKKYRSIMNVVFTLPNPELEKLFIDQAGKQGMKNLDGHRSVGGMRASIYNAMSVDGVDALVKFMKDFEKENG